MQQKLHSVDLKKNGKRNPLMYEKMLLKCCLAGFYFKIY